MKYILLLVVGLICGCDNLGKLEHSYAVAGCNATVTKHLNGVALHLFSGQTNEPLQVDGVLFAVDAISVKPEGFQALLKELKDNSSERIYIELPRRITEDFIRDLTDIDGIYLVSAHMSNLSNGSLKQLLAMNQLTHIYLGPECGFEAADVKTLEKNNVTVHGVGAENSHTKAQKKGDAAACPACPQGLLTRLGYLPCVVYFTQLIWEGLLLVYLLMARSLILVAVSAKVSTMLAVPCTAMTIEAHWRYDIRGNRNSVTRYNAKTYSKVSYELT